MGAYFSRGYAPAAWGLTGVVPGFGYGNMFGRGSFPAALTYGNTLPTMGMTNTMWMNGGSYSASFFGSNLNGAWPGFYGFPSWTGYPLGISHPGMGTYSYGNNVGYGGGLGNVYTGIGFGGWNSFPAGSPSSFSYGGMSSGSRVV